MVGGCAAVRELGADREAECVRGEHVREHVDALGLGIGGDAVGWKESG